jgi:hypothetical protein
MAIKDLKKRLETDEANSGEALAKKLETALDAVYNKGWSSFVGTQNAGLSVKGADSLWEESYKEILSEGKRAVKATKKDKATEIRNDMVSLVSDIAATSGVNAPIAAGIQEMLDAVLPIVNEKIDALKKSDTVFKSMKKNAIKSAASAVEGFASGILAPLPFGMGDAMLGKAKGLLGGNTERREEKAMAFASRLEDSETSGGSGKESGGIVSSASGGSSDSGEADGGKVVEILTEMEEHLQHIRDNTESAESRRERLRNKGVKGAGGKIAGAGAGMDGGDEDGFGALDALRVASLMSFVGGKGGLFSNIFRNIKAALLRITRKVFGKGGGVVLSKVLSGLGFAGRLAGIAGVIIAPLIDGITGWFKADEWKTTKGKAVIGAAIGGTGSGASGAAWNALKGGAIGFAVGGPLGALAGVLIGAITGWFGGERIAKALTDIENFFSSKWDSMMISLGFKEETEASNNKTITDAKADIKKLTAANPENYPFPGTQDGLLNKAKADLAKANEKKLNNKGGKGFKTNAQIESEKKKINNSLTLNRRRLREATDEHLFDNGENQQQKDSMEKAISIDEERLEVLVGNRRTGGPIHSSGMYNLHAGEMVMDNQAAGIMMSAVSIAGQTMNQNAMARVGYGGMGGVGSAPTVIDSSSQTVINNVANYIPPQPSGQLLPGSGRDNFYR